jgi:hypothetical protein
VNASHFIVNKIFVIEDGELSFVEGGGAKVDLSVPRYEFLQDAAFKAGYSVTFPIRQADFGTTLARIGIQRRGSGNLEALLQRSSEAVRY